MPVIESPTAVAVQNYTQLDDPGLHFYFHHNNADKAVQLYLINFNLEFCSFTLHFILHVFLLFVVVVVLLGKVRLITFTPKSGALDGEITMK